MSKMDCDLCMRSFNGRRKPICPSCVHATLYQSRVLHATTLLSREKSHSQVEAIIRPGNDGVLATLPEDIDFDAITTGMKKHGFELCQSERVKTDNRVEMIMENTEQLRKEIEAYRSHMALRRQDLVHRRKRLATETAELEKLKARLLYPVQIALRKAALRLERTRDKIVDSRALLCREAALAWILEMYRGSISTAAYFIGGTVIMDLRQLGMQSRAQPLKATSSFRTLAEPHAVITAAMENVARLVVIISHYLSVRLPAEIVLPHGDSPWCVIMPEKASYKFDEVRLHGQISSQTNSPTASKVMDPSLPRPRPLFLDHPLANLSKEDSKSYGLFVEGVSLLAWNIAWLCRTQGIDNIDTFEDFCKIGRNLWQLTAAQTRKPLKPPLDRKISGASEPEPHRKPAGYLQLGLFSHASAGSNLASAQGLDLMKDWSLASPARMTDRLKTYLLTEIQGAEWDLLEEQEWEQERDDEMAVLVGGSERPQDSRHPAMSVMTVGPHDLDSDAKNATLEDKKKNSSGWMKIRGRNEEI